MLLLREERLPVLEPALRLLPERLLPERLLPEVERLLPLALARSLGERLLGVLALLPLLAAWARLPPLAGEEEEEDLEEEEELRDAIACSLMDGMAAVTAAARWSI